MSLTNDAWEDIKKKKDASAQIAAGGYGVQPTTVISAPKPPEGSVGVRESLTGAGLDPSKIGWKDGAVTYGNRSFVPDANIGGTTYASKDKVNSFISDIQADNGNIGVRKTLTDLGLDPSKIGWKDGMVTYNGESYKPTVNANGTTFGAAKDVYDFADRAMRTEGDSLVQVNKYRPANGLYSVDWNDAERKVLVGGENTPYVFIDAGGNAWAKRSVLDDAYARLGERTGVKSLTDLDNERRARTEQIDSLYDEDLSREFSYNPETDPVYQAYRDMYTREGARAYDDMLVRASARTGGYSSSMARSQANQQRNYYLSKLNDVIPQLAAEAYSRYIQDRQNDISTIGKKEALYDGIYNDDIAMHEYARGVYEAQEDKEAARPYNELSLDKARSDTGAAIAENTYNTAALYNRPFTEEEAARYGIAPNADGTYPTPQQLVISQQLEIWDKYEKGIYDYKRAAELEDQIALIAYQYGIDLQLLKDKYAMKTTGTKKTGNEVDAGGFPGF